MPYAAPQYCLEPGCGEKVPTGYCRLHKVTLEHRRGNYDVRRWYRQARWRALRRVVLREQPLCEDCLAMQPPRHVLATDVHHRVRHEGDEQRFFDRTNLGSLCASHHSRRTGQGE